MHADIGYTETIECLMLHRIVRLNLNWKKIIMLLFINLK